MDKQIKLMLSITSIQPQYRIDEKNNRQVDHYIVEFSMRKKLSDGNMAGVTGTIEVKLDIDIEEINSKIRFHLENVILNS